MKMKPELTFEDAERLMGYLRKEANDLNRGMACALVDDHGELVSFFKTDGCPPSAVIIAQNKAFTAARDRQESKKLWHTAQAMKISGTDLGDIRFTTLGGGVPLVYDDHIVGALGVSGMAEEEDRALALRAAEQLNQP